MGGNAIVSIWGITAIVSMVLGGLIAQWKHRDWSFWAAWSFLLPPAVIILSLMPKLPGGQPRRRRPTLDEEDRVSDHT